MSPRFAQSVVSVMTIQERSATPSDYQRPPNRLTGSNGLHDVHYVSRLYLFMRLDVLKRTVNNFHNNSPYFFFSKACIDAAA